jgi:hypothetical protein
MASLEGASWNSYTLTLALVVYAWEWARRATRIISSTLNTHSSTRQIPRNTTRRRIRDRRASPTSQNEREVCGGYVSVEGAVGS